MSESTHKLYIEAAIKMLNEYQKIEFKNFQDGNVDHAYQSGYKSGIAAALHMLKNTFIDLEEESAK